MAVITPESTVLQFELAGVGSRFAATLVDSLVQAAAVLTLAGIAWAARALGGDWLSGAAWIWPLALLGSWLVLWGYHVWFELRWNGQTPGKRLLRLRVIREDGLPVDFTASSLRNILRYLDLLPLVAPYLLGGLAAGLTDRVQRLGDLIAATVVIRERQPAWLEQLVQGGEQAGEPVVEPPAAALLGRLTGEEIAVCAAFLRRAPSLPLEQRRQLAARLAGRLRERFGLARPLLAPLDWDEAWLAAVVTAWAQRRRAL